MQINVAGLIDMTSRMNYPPLTDSRRKTWVQTDREAHEEWGHLTVSSPRAAALMHHLVAHMDESAAVVASYSTLSKISRMSLATVRRAIDDLKAGNWLQVVQIGGKGAANAFVVNSRVGWAAPRDMLHLAVFTARVLANPDEQDPVTLAGPELRRLPVLRHGESQLPTGPGLEPPSQPALAGLEPDLPGIQAQTQTRRQQITLARLRDEFQVDVTEALELSGEALEAWLARVERSLFERLTGQGQLTLDGGA